MSNCQSLLIYDKNPLASVILKHFIKDFVNDVFILSELQNLEKDLIEQGEFDCCIYLIQDTNFDEVFIQSLKNLTKEIEIIFFDPLVQINEEKVIELLRLVGISTKARITSKYEINPLKLIEYFEK